MKNIIKLFSVLLLLLSCDKEVYYDFIVENNCDKSIIVTLIDYKNTVTTKTVIINEQLIVYSSIGLNKLTDEKIESVFNSIIVTKDNDTAIRNYLDRNQWQFVEESDTKANCYLIVDSTDFK
jgi:hypothetical protein